MVSKEVEWWRKEGHHRRYLKPILAQISDLIAIKGIPSLYFSCLSFLYLTVGFTTMEGTLFLWIILLFFHLFKFFLVADKQGVFFCLNVVWLSIKQDETNWAFIFFVWVIISAFFYWLKSGWLVVEKTEKRNGDFLFYFYFMGFWSSFCNVWFLFFFFFFFFG